MPLTIATWNINSVRLRMPIVERFLEQWQPDVLCLQETKCPDEFFPFEPFRRLGYNHVEISGQKGYHGVATISRRPLEVVEKRRFCETAGTCRRVSRPAESRCCCTISTFRQAATSPTP
jgi:exodeoxyribonuclease III